MMATMSLQAAYDQARTYLEANRVDAAIGVAQHILTYFPENLEAHRILGEAYLAGRQFDQAEAAFKRVIHSDPENIPAHVGLGITFERQGKLPQAIVEFEQALEVRPDMPELRNQLLRLYTDVWGAENATLRLSKPGLARLYAKGHMLPQAIQEFRNVIDEMPERFDARIGLAEALWRDGQEDSAADVCAEILQLRPDALKANLLLGYARISAGDSSGETLWNMAQQLDPYQGVARVLFDTLPDVPGPELNIPTWDETTWAENQAREREAEAAHVVTAAAAGTAGAAAAASFDDDDFFNEPWAATPPEAPPAPSAADDDFLANLLAFDAADLPDPNEGATVEETGDITPFNFDDFDASGSRSSAPAATESSSVTPAEEPELTAFSFEELGLSEAEIAALNESPATEAEQAHASKEPTVADEMEMLPFSLADLGLNDDEIAALNETPASEAGTSPSAAELDLDVFSFDEEVPAPAAETPTADEPLLEAFSFEDLGLSDDEIASLNAASQPAAETPAADEPLLEAFSFEDLGLSDDEIASLNAASQPAAETPQSDEPALTPFSFEDLGLSDDEIASLNAASQPAAETPQSDEPALTPFSLADLGLSDDEIASLDEATTSDMPGPDPFSLEDLNLDVPPSAAAGTPAGTGAQPFDWGDAEESSAGSEMDGVDIGDLQPFSLDDLDLNATSEDDYNSSSLPSSLQAFSLDDTPLPQRPAGHEPPLPGTDEHSESGAYSWQQPSAKRNTDFLNNAAAAEPAGPSIFAKLRQRSQDLPREEEGPLPPVTLSDEETAAYFSSDDIPLREEDGSPERLTTDFRLPRDQRDIDLEESAEPKAPAASAAPFAPDLTPFSFEELGLTPEELAALEGNAPEGFAQIDSDAEPELTPFSFEELGLTPEELAALEGNAPEGFAQIDSDAEPELTPFSFEELGLTPEEIAALEGDASEEDAPAFGADDEPALTPFSFEELGLTPEEIAALEGGAVEEFAAPAQPADAEPELKPFSLAELGLSPEEIAALEGGAATGETIIPGWSQGEEPSMEPFAANEAGEPDMGDPFSFDDFDPAEPATSGSSGASDEAAFDELGLDEDVQPFSLDDLGLNDFDMGGPENSRELGLTADELAGLDLGELETFAPGAAKASSAHDNDIEQVDTGDPALDKLIMLGRRHGFVDLTDIIGVVADPEAEAERIEEIGWTLHRAGIQIRDGDEIIDMDGEESEEAEAQPALEEDFEEFSTTAPAEPVFGQEPELTPFSLEELGLSPEEIAALGLSEADATVAPEPPAKPAAPEPPKPQPTPPAQPAADMGEPELTPFSLEELGLSPEEIAALGLGESDATFASEPPVAEPPAAAETTPLADDEPELAPFSLEELGLSPEEIAALGLNEANATVAPEPPAALPPAPAATPTPPAAEEEDLFDFDLIEEKPVERAVRTAPREEAPPPPPPSTDTTFVPAELDTLDDIWDAPPPVEAEAPARVVLPPRSERPQARPQRPSSSAGASSSSGRTPPPTRDDARFARREAARAGVATNKKPASVARSYASFIPTGEEMLDQYLEQLDAEPQNYGLALAMARMSAETGRAELMTTLYRHLIKEGQLIDEIASEVEELLESVDNTVTRRQLARVLGDVYSKQGRYREAMTAYSSTFSR